MLGNLVTGDVTIVNIYEPKRPSDKNLHVLYTTIVCCTIFFVTTFAMKMLLTITLHIIVTILFKICKYFADYTPARDCSFLQQYGTHRALSKSLKFSSE